VPFWPKLICDLYRVLIEIYLNLRVLIKILPSLT